MGIRQEVSFTLARTPLQPSVGPLNKWLGVGLFSYDCFGNQWCQRAVIPSRPSKTCGLLPSPHPHPPQKKRIPLLVELKNIPPYIFQDPFEWVRRWFVSGGLKSHPFFRLGDDVSDSRFPRCRLACASWSPGGNIDAGMGGIWQVGGRYPRGGKFSMV